MNHQGKKRLRKPRRLSKKHANPFALIPHFRLAILHGTNRNPRLGTLTGAWLLRKRDLRGLFGRGHAILIASIAVDLVKELVQNGFKK
jgi:hypothetical protein